MQFYTITERRDDPRLTQFCQFAEANSATSVLVITRPQHVAADPQLLVVAQSDIAAQRQRASDLAAQRNFIGAQECEEKALETIETVKKLQADAAQWLTDALQQASLASSRQAAGFVVMPDSQWKAEWTPAAFLVQANSIETHGIAGNKFTTPLTRRIFVPLCQFDAAQLASKKDEAAAANNADAASGILNRPATAPTQTDLTQFTQPQAHMLRNLNENQRRALIAYLGWDRGGKPRAPRTAANQCGMSYSIFVQQIKRIAATLSQDDIDLVTIYDAGGGNAVAEETPTEKSA